MERIPIIREKQLMLNLLMLFMFSIGIVVSIIALIWEKRKETILKVSGVILVTALAILSDHGGIYALAIFIVATFITELDFLENIAALFWGRDKYWDYKKAIVELSKANKEEVDKKIEMEVEEAIKTGVVNSMGDKGRLDFTKADSPMDVYRRFEREAIDLLKERYVLDDIEEQIRINYNDRRFIVDGVGRKGNNHFIIDIKMTNSEQVISRTVGNIKNYMDAYRAYLINNKTRWDQVKGIMIIPDLVEIPNVIAGIGILKYDMESNEFTNLIQLTDWLNS